MRDDRQVIGYPDVDRVRRQFRRVGSAAEKSGGAFHGGERRLYLGRCVFRIQRKTDHLL